MMSTHDADAFGHVWQLYGYTILDSHGAHVGPVNKVWTDNATGTLTFIGLRTGWLLGTTHVIPAAHAPVDDVARSIRVPYPVDRIRNAPSHNTDIPLTDKRKEEVATYYDHH